MITKDEFEAAKNVIEQYRLQLIKESNKLFEESQTILWEETKINPFTKITSDFDISIRAHKLLYNIAEGLLHKERGDECTLFEISRISPALWKFYNTGWKTKMEVIDLLESVGLYFGYSNDEILKLIGYGK